MIDTEELELKLSLQNKRRQRKHLQKMIDTTSVITQADIFGKLSVIIGTFNLHTGQQCFFAHGETRAEAKENALKRIEELKKEIERFDD